MQLKDMRVGDKGIISALQVEDSCCRNRLIAMGLLPGTPFRVTAMAPLGDPVEIEVRGFRLLLRKHESLILVEEESLQEC